MAERSKEQSTATTELSDVIAHPGNPPRSNIVRDGFSMPEEDYRLIETIKRACLQGGIIATKSGILRAALKALSRLSPDEQVTLLQSLAPVKTGRPPSQK